MKLVKRPKLSEIINVNKFLLHTSPKANKAKIFNKLFWRKTAIQNAENKYVEVIIERVFADLILMSAIKMVLIEFLYFIIFTKYLSIS